MQQPRLTDSHSAGRIRARGFEIVKTRIGASLTLTRLMSAERSFAAQQDFCSQAPRAAKNALKMHNICG
jgi:hypothetical protein